jgi:hypothetical protein
MRQPRAEIQPLPRSDPAPRAASGSGGHGLRHARRRPASEPAPLTAPRIFVSSRRRRHPILVVTILVLLWVAALTAATSAVI